MRTGMDLDDSVTQTLSNEKIWYKVKNLQVSNKKRFVSFVIMTNIIMILKHGKLKNTQAFLQNYVTDWILLLFYVQYMFNDVTL